MEEGRETSGLGKERENGAREQGKYSIKGRGRRCWCPREVKTKDSSFCGKETKLINECVSWCTVKSCTTNRTGYVAMVIIIELCRKDRHEKEN